MQASSICSKRRHMGTLQRVGAHGHLTEVAALVRGGTWAPYRGFLCIGCTDDLRPVPVCAL
eukprot:55364-Pelagomonas_calceolata.AAC.5